MSNVELYNQDDWTFGTSREYLPKTTAEIQLEHIMKNLVQEKSPDLQVTEFDKTPV